MQDYIKKYFWVTTVIVVMVCAGLTAKATNHVLEAKLLGDRAEPAKMQKKKRRTVRRTQTLSKSGEPLAERNMFCSECKPPEPDEPDPDSPTEGDNVPLTSLPLRLVATNVSSKEAYSFATIRNTNSDHQGAYWVSDSIPDAGKIKRIAGKYVDFVNESSKRVERISLLGKDVKAPRRTTTRKPKRNTRRGRRAELMAAIDAGIKKTGASSYQIDRSLVNKLLANPMGISRGARIVPSIKNGKPNGFKLYAIRPSSIYAKLGLMNGDTLHAVNNYELTTANKALEVYSKVKSASNLTVSVTRRGKPVTLDYSIR